jgi:VanZ family protein
MNLICWLEKHPVITWGITLAYMSIIFLLSSIPYPRQPLPMVPYLPVIEHIIEYAILGFLLSVALKKRNERLEKTLFLAILIATLYGITDEVHQFFVPGRTASIYDVISNSLGATIGTTSKYLSR